MKNLKLLSALAWAGALPFIVCALLSVAGIRSVSELGLIDDVALSYGLVITAFMAGVLWGIALLARSTDSSPYFLASNVVAIAAWLSFLLATREVTYFVLIVALGALLAADYRLFKAGSLVEGYWTLRRNVTVAVAVSLAVTAAYGA